MCLAAPLACSPICFVCTLNAAYDEPCHAEEIKYRLMHIDPLNISFILKSQLYGWYKKKKKKKPLKLTDVIFLKKQVTGIAHNNSDTPR